MLVALRARDISPAEKEEERKKFDKYHQVGSRIMGEIVGKTMPKSIYTSYDQVSGTGWQTPKNVAFGSRPWPFFIEEFPAAGWEHEDFQLYTGTYPQPWIPGWNGQYIASYRVFANPVAGVLVVDNANSPKYPLVSPADPNRQPPPLNRLSDFMFLAYKRACGTTYPLSGLQWVMHYQVVNQSSLQVMEAIMGGDGGDDGYPEWPGTILDLQEDEDRVATLLGCPNGWSVGYMLGQHAHTELGRKAVDKVAIVGNAAEVPNRIKQNLAFHIVDLKDGGDKGKDSVLEEVKNEADRKRKNRGSDEDEDNAGKKLRA